MKGRLTVRLTDELEKGVAVLAQKLRRRRSEIVRLALQRFIREEDQTGDGRPFDLVKELLGSVESYVPDLGSNHRKHLNSRFRREV